MRRSEKLGVGRMKRNSWCPICGGAVPCAEAQGEYPGALSRFDNETEICSACGSLEALGPMCSDDRAMRPLIHTLMVAKADRDWDKWARTVRRFAAKVTTAWFRDRE